VKDFCKSKIRAVEERRKAEKFVLILSRIVMTCGLNDCGNVAALDITKGVLI